MNHSLDCLKKAIQIAGSQSALAKLIGVSQSHISMWLRRNKKVPAEQVIKIEKAVKGAVSRHDLRPDIYPRFE